MWRYVAATPCRTGRPANWYMLRHDGSINQESLGRHRSDPPVRLQIILSGLNATHHDWWECDTGIAYLIAGSASDGWHSGAACLYL